MYTNKIKVYFFIHVSGVKFLAKNMVLFYHLSMMKKIDDNKKIKDHSRRFRKGYLIAKNPPG